MSHAPEPPRRRADRIVGAVLAVLGVAVAVVAVVALQNPEGRKASTVTANVGTSGARASARAPSRGRSPTTRPRQTPSTSRPVALIVLNNTTVPRLADVAAARFRAGGWQVTATADFSDDILSTCAYYDPADPAAQPAAVALQQQFPAIRRVKEKFAGLPAGPVVVVLTTDYSATVP